MQQTSTQLAVPVGEHDHIQGPSTAPMTLVEYGDFECPYCGAAYVTVKAVQRRLGDRLRFVFRNFPLGQMHPHAELAAEAAEEAAAQGRFWEMHDQLYAHQQALEAEQLAGYAEDAGLDVERFVHALEQHTHAPRVREEFLGGVRSGVNGTPTFFINGVRRDGSYDLDVLLDALEGASQ